MDLPEAARSWRREGIWWMWLAACVGCVHAGFSLYWAAGGTWLLDTVGRWAVQAAAEGSSLVTAGLVGIGLLKLIAAFTPAVGEQLATSRLRRWIRRLSWVGALGLTAYGAANTVVAALVLTEVIRSDGGFDRAAMVGHALLWDPLFLVWGIFLLAGLALTRPRRDGLSGE